MYWKRKYQILVFVNFDNLKKFLKRIDVEIIEVSKDSVEKLYVMVKGDNRYKCIIGSGTNRGNTQGFYSSIIFIF